MIKKNFIILLIFIILWQCKGENVLNKEDLLKYGKENYEENSGRYREIVKIILNSDIPLEHYIIDYLIKFDDIIVKDKNSHNGKTELFSNKKQEKLKKLLRQDDLTVIVKKNQTIKIRLDYRNTYYNYLTICYLYPDYNLYKEYKNFEILKGAKEPTQEEKWIYIIDENWILYVP